MEKEKKITTLELNSKFSLREIVLKYVSYLPLFVLSLTLSLGIAYLYIRYTIPIYRASVTMMVGSNGEGRSSQEDLISRGLFGVRTINLDNEMELIKSRKLLEKVVKNNDFNISYFNNGKIKNSDIYVACPFVLIPVVITDSTKNYSWNVVSMDAKGGKFKVNGKVQNFSWYDTLKQPGISFVMSPRYASVSPTDEPFTVNWIPSAQAAAQIQGRLSVSPFSLKTTIVSMSLITENLKRGQDILNALVKECIIRDVDMRRENSFKTVEFIDNRLQLLVKELGDVEGVQLDYRKKNGFLDIETEFGFIRGKLNIEEDRIENFELQVKIVELIEDYLKSQKGDNKILPSSLGLDDGVVNGMIVRYNDAVVKRDQESFISKKESFSIIEMDKNISELKKNIYEGLRNLKSNYKLKINEYYTRSGEYSTRLGTIPEKERELDEIKRLKKVKENLYMYLLQKREEAAISTISTKSNYQEMDPAGGSNVPYEPRVSQIKSFALLLGLVIPVALIYLLDLLNDKVTTRDDILKKTNAPIVGEISHVDSNLELVIDNSRNIIAEQFRILRTNMQFVLPPLIKGRAQSVLVTSTISGEGKSFISLNLAAVLSLTGKKVALLEFDLRKLQSLKIINNEGHAKGLTNYLINQIDDIPSLKFSLEKYPSLDIFSTGPIPPNPAELIISDRMTSLFTYLRANYDYIVIDSAPVGLVSDSFALSDHADAVLYIIRQRYTYKKQLDFLNEIREAEKLKNVSLVVNDVNLGGRYGYYGYGYGYGYGYMYKYGKGYKYGYGKYGLYGTKGKSEYFDANKGYFDDAGDKKKKGLFK